MTILNGLVDEEDFVIYISRLLDLHSEKKPKAVTQGRGEYEDHPR